MTIARLPETHATLYAELLEQSLAYDRAAAAAGLHPGGPVTKEIRGRRYVYWQVRGGGHTAQRYLGLDEPELRAALDDLAARKANIAPDKRALERLGAMLVRGGAAREEAGAGAALRLLAELGFFRRGATVVGTQAFRCYGNALGVVLEASTLRTQDIDVAHDLAVALASAAEPPPATERELGRLGFLPVPGMNPREPSTSFKVRGRELRIDFLVAARSTHAEAPVQIPALGIAAQPVSFLDYLIAEPMPAVVLAQPPTLVRIPSPERFALHKLWTAASRPASQAGKSRKDRAQAQALLGVLLQDRPADLRHAWRALGSRTRARRLVLQEARALSKPIADDLLQAVEA